MEMFKHLLEKNPEVKDALMEKLKEDDDEKDITFIGAMITFVKKYEEVEKVCKSRHLAKLARNVPV